MYDRMKEDKENLLVGGVCLVYTMIVTTAWWRIRIPKAFIKISPSTIWINNIESLCFYPLSNKHTATDVPLALILTQAFCDKAVRFLSVVGTHSPHGCIREMRETTKRTKATVAWKRGLEKMPAACVTHKRQERTYMPYMILTTLNIRLLLLVLRKTVEE